jgi:hypothetical protein
MYEHDMNFFIILFRKSSCHSTTCYIKQGLSQLFDLNDKQSLFFLSHTLFVCKSSVLQKYNFICEYDSATMETPLISERKNKKKY